MDSPAPSTQHPRGAELSTREAAIALGRNVRSIRRAIERGELAAVKRGTAYWIAADELMRFAARGDFRTLPGPRARLVPFPAAPHAMPSLPQPLSSFIGRADDLAAVVALLAEPAVRVLTLTGPGGIGKTRLALAIASSMDDRFVDGALFVDLSDISSPADVIPAIAQGKTGAANATPSCVANTFCLSSTTSSRSSTLRRRSRRLSPKHRA